MPVHGPSEESWVPVRVDCGELLRAPAGAVGVFAESAGSSEVGEPLSDGLVEGGGVAGCGQGPGLGVVRTRGGEVLLESGVPTRTRGSGRQLLHAALDLGSMYASPVAGLPYLFAAAEDPGTPDFGGGVACC
ncbi:hypothetical protein JCM13580A_61990 [Streptomyces drozdowiczii]